MRRDSGLRIRSLTDPTKKMSKSSTDEKSKILLADSPEIAIKKIMSATTDSIGVINFDWDNQPGVTSLLQILSMLSGRSRANVNDEWVGNTNYGTFKSVVAEAVAAFLSEFQARLANVSDESLLTKLASSEAEMTKIADQTLLRAQIAVGLRPKDN
jgi:tryptophanyl-tRNA synthetase